MSFTDILNVVRELIPIIVRPRIVIEGINDSECVYTKDGFTAMRLKLTNKNSLFGKTGQNCYAKLIGIKKGEQKNIISEPILLSWISSSSYKNNLSVGETHLIDLASTQDNKITFLRKHQIKGDLKRVFPRINLDAGTYTLQVGIYGGNFKAIVKTFKIEVMNNTTKFV